MAEASFSTTPLSGVVLFPQILPPPPHRGGVVAKDVDKISLLLQFGDGGTFTGVEGAPPAGEGSCLIWIGDETVVMELLLPLPATLPLVTAEGVRAHADDVIAIGGVVELGKLSFLTLAETSDELEARALVGVAIGFGIGGNGGGCGGGAASPSDFIDAVLDS